jgi:hypothetical protein
VFENLTHRLAVYRGLEPSERDMTFSWELSGGFVPLTASLVTVGGSTAVLPQQLRFVPQLGALAVTDGAEKGLLFVSLDSVSVAYMYY